MKYIASILCIFFSFVLTLNAQCYLETLTCGTLKATLDNIPQRLLESHEHSHSSKYDAMPDLTFSLEKEITAGVWKKVKQLKTNAPEVIFENVETGTYRVTTITTASIGKSRTKIHGHDKSFQTSYDGFSSNVVEITSCSDWKGLGFKSTIDRILIRPNPANDMIYLSGLPTDKGKLTALFYDLSGRTLLTQDISSSATDIRVSTIEEGIYFLKLKSADNEPIAIRKVAIVR